MISNLNQQSTTTKKKYEYEYEKQHEDDQSEKSDVGYEDGNGEGEKGEKSDIGYEEDNGEEGEYENDEGFFYEYQKNKDEIAPLYAAIEEGNQGIVQLLLTNDPKIYEYTIKTAHQGDFQKILNLTSFE